MYLGITNETGQLEVCFLNPGGYTIFAVYQSTQFGCDVFLGVDENGNGYSYIPEYGYEITSPVIEILSPQSIAYTGSSVPLTFTVYDFSAISWIGYSLDGRPIITIAGNTTLTGLSYGYHNVIVYANDTYGNMGISNKISFTRSHIASVLRTPITPNYDEDVIVSTITDTAVDNALLSYTYDMTWHNVSMNKFDDTFNGTIPSQAYGTLVQYRIYANDTSGNWTESNTYSYIV